MTDGQEASDDRRGVRVSVAHPDFAEVSERATFIDAFVDAWPEGDTRIYVDPAGHVDGDLEIMVDLFFPYGVNGAGVRDAEMSAASAIAMISTYAAERNRSGRVFPAYAFHIERDVPLP